VSDGDAPAPPAPDADFELLRSATLDWVHALAGRLEAAEIDCQVVSLGDARSRDAPWAVYVHRDDLVRARAVDAEVLREVVPDIPEDFDPASLDTERCPACEEPVAEGAPECASCGLALL